jgi:N6-adenosine-specific RNA methylase IME4
MDLWEGFPNQKFDIVIMDPPWKYYGSGTKDQACAKHYPCLDFDQLKTLPVHQINPQIVFMWVTATKIEQGIELFKSWNLSFRGIQFVWVKTNSKGGIINAQGVRPSIVKPSCEFVIAATKRTKGRPLPLACESVPMTVLARRKEHSRKPDDIQNWIGKMYPDQSKLELFARRKLDGWTCWGNELTENS